MGALQGVYLPIITPFHNDELDLESYQNLVRHYLEKGISGLIPMGTTGESHAVTEVEFEKIIESTLEITNRSIPVYIGVGGNITAKVIEKIKNVEELERQIRELETTKEELESAHTKLDQKLGLFRGWFDETLGKYHEA